MSSPIGHKIRQYSERGVSHIADIENGRIFTEKCGLAILQQWVIFNSKLTMMWLNGLRATPMQPEATVWALHRTGPKSIYPYLGNYLLYPSDNISQFLSL